MQLFKKLFKRQPLAAVNAETLEHAHYELAMHLAALEYHHAMIDMYESRIQRLERQGAAS